MIVDDVDKEIEAIRKRGERVLDEFEEILLNDARRASALPHLEELKRRQDDITAILDEARRRPK